MARILQVYPKASLQDAEWRVVLKVSEDGGSPSRFGHIFPATVVANDPLTVHKIVFDLEVGDGDTDQDVDDALFADDIHPAPGQTETVWGNWQATAEGIIAGLEDGYTAADFGAAWTQGDTASMRSDAQRALVSGPGAIGRGWTIIGFHQHEGDPLRPVTEG